MWSTCKYTKVTKDIYVTSTYSGLCSIEVPGKGLLRDYEHVFGLHLTFVWSSTAQCFDNLPPPHTQTMLLPCDQSGRTPSLSCPWPPPPRSWSITSDLFTPIITTGRLLRGVSQMNWDSLKRMTILKKTRPDGLKAAIHRHFDINGQEGLVRSSKAVRTYVFFLP